MPEAGQAGSSWLGSKLPEIPWEQYFKPWHFKQMNVSLLSPSFSPFPQCSHIFFLNTHYLDTVVTQNRFQSFASTHRTEQPQEHGFEGAEETSSWVHTAWNTELQKRTSEGETRVSHQNQWYWHSLYIIWHSCFSSGSKVQNLGSWSSPWSSCA